MQRTETMEQTLTPQLGQRLKDRREELGWSLRDLEERSGVHNSLIFKIETGRVRDPSLEKVRALADAMDCSATRMLIEDDQLDLPSYGDFLQLLHPGLSEAVVTRLERHLTRTVNAAAAAVGEET